MFYAVMIMVLAFYISHFNTFRWHKFVHAIATAYTHKYILYDYSINDCALCVFLCICVKATTPPRCCTFILRTKHANRQNCRIARATSPKESHGACHTHSSITVRTMRDASLVHACAQPLQSFVVHLTGSAPSTTILYISNSHTNDACTSTPALATVHLPVHYMFMV